MAETTVAIITILLLLLQEVVAKKVVLPANRIERELGDNPTRLQ